MSAPHPEPAIAAIVHSCAVFTPTGEPVTEALGVILPRPTGIEVRLTELTAPGVFLNLHLGKGLRRFLLSIDEGRPRPADLAATHWGGAGRRVATFHLPATG